MELGPSHRGVDEILLDGKGEGLARIRLPGSSTRGVPMDPGALDSIIQSGIALVENPEANVVPFAVTSTMVVGDLVDTMYVHIRRRADGMDYVAADENGSVRVIIEGFQTREICPEREAGSSELLPAGLEDHHAAARRRPCRPRGGGRRALHRNDKGGAVGREGAEPGQGHAQRPRVARAGTERHRAWSLGRAEDALAGAAAHRCPAEDRKRACDAGASGRGCGHRRRVRVEGRPGRADQRRPRRARRSGRRRHCRAHHGQHPDPARAAHAERGGRGANGRAPAFRRGSGVSPVRRRQVRGRGEGRRRTSRHPGRRARGRV